MQKVEDVGLSGSLTAYNADECVTLICVKVAGNGRDGSQAALLDAARRIRRNIRRGDNVLVGERLCAILLPQTTVEGAQAVAYRLTSLLVDVECELEILYGPAARAQWQRQLSEQAILLSIQEHEQGYVPLMRSALPIPYLAFLDDYPPRRLLHLFPYELARRFRCIPVGEEQAMLTVAAIEQLDEAVIGYFEQVTQHSIFQVRCEVSFIEEVLRYWQQTFEAEIVLN